MIKSDNSSVIKDLITVQLQCKEHYYKANALSTLSALSSLSTPDS